MSQYQHIRYYGDAYGISTWYLALNAFACTEQFALLLNPPSPSLARCSAMVLNLPRRGRAIHRYSTNGLEGGPRMDQGTAQAIKAAEPIKGDRD
jgi:hypothetical protein